MVKTKTIFEYDNYRAFLKDFYTESKEKRPAFSFRSFSRLVGFSSPSFLKHVMEGARNLSPESIDKIIKAIKLNKEEATFFKNLVLFNQATTVTEKHEFSQELLRSKSHRKMHPLMESELLCLSRWYYIPIRELVGMAGFKEDPLWIAKKLQPPISPNEAKQALDDLQKSGLLERNPQGNLVQTNRFVGVVDEVARSSLAQCHKELIKKASDSIDSIPRDKREIGAITLRLSPEKIKKIKEMIHIFREEVVEEASRDESPNGIYQFTFQLFPLAVVEKDEEKT